MERLQKIIAERGYCSRRKAEQLISEGRVSVNGETVDVLGFKAERDAEIRIDGNLLEQEEKVVFLLNKPKNVISSVKDEKGRTTVIDLIDFPYRIYPLGRLDYDSSGLLLLSNDGELMQKLLMNLDIPAPMRKLVPRSHFEARIGRLTEEVKANFYSNLENEKNAAITERMVTEITGQIEQCLTKMAEIVEIPL